MHSGGRSGRRRPRSSACRPRRRRSAARAGDASSHSAAAGDLAVALAAPGGADRTGLRQRGAADPGGAARGQRCVGLGRGGESDPDGGGARGDGVDADLEGGGGGADDVAVAQVDADVLAAGGEDEVADLQGRQRARTRRRPIAPGGSRGRRSRPAARAAEVSPPQS